ncbi:MAG: hypothetical protein HYZ14_11750 [Bacteroidetes bacterium]|nr:hypothetical protein [Bacteroidota bacterium]
MPKYRLLTKEELYEFEKEFVEFLVVNGIEPEKWQYIKENDLQSAEKIIELFSDVILESVLRNVKFIELKSKKYVHAIQCLTDKMVSIALEDSAPDNQKSGAEEQRENSLSIYKSEKTYSEKRETEIFDLLQKGYQISDGDLFKKLQLASLG